MPDLVLILWLPVTIAAMAVAWVVTLGAIGRTRPLADEPVPSDAHGSASPPVRSER